MLRTFGILVLASLSLHAQQVTGQDLDKILDRADKLLEEAKASYEDARAKSTVAGFVEAGFKLEDARIKFLVLQEIGSEEKQKVAAERLRAINQLSKLIHDGKVAVGGTPAEAAPKPADPAAPPTPKEPLPKPADPPPAAPAVTKRTAVPDAAKQREAERLIKDIYKEQYAKKAPADRKALAKTLLSQARKATDDPVTLWVLYREAQDISVQAGDAAATVDAIESAARLFDFDPLAAKATSLPAAARAAKTNEELFAAAWALIVLAEDLMGADQYEPAERSAGLALQYGKKASDSTLVARATLRSREITEARGRFQSMKSVLQTLARNSDDPGANLEMGQFLCFVKGSWDLGLRFLAKGSDEALKGLATKDLSSPVESADQVAVADGWWDLSDRESATGKKSRLQERARFWYEAASPRLSGLAKVRVDRRLEAKEAPPKDVLPKGAVDLLKLIDPKQDAVLGDWTMESGVLISPAKRVPYARVQIPYSMPAEYDLTVSIKSSAPVFTMGIGLPLGDRQCVFMIGQKEGKVSAALEMIDGKGWWQPENPTRADLTIAASAKVHCLVRRSGITVIVDGKKVVEWRDLKRLSLYEKFAVSGKDTVILLPDSLKVEFDQVFLFPVSGPGRKLR